MPAIAFRGFSAISAYNADLASNARRKRETASPPCSVG
jgi:hypothetical protein